MRIVVVGSANDTAKVALDSIKETLKKKPNSVICFPTGSSPLPLYNAMVEDYKKKKTSYKDVITFNLDEYKGLGSKHNQSYRYFMDVNLFNNIDINPDNINFPNGVLKDLKGECARYHKLLEENHRDIQILGIGSNGHIGFNEPGTPFDSTTHVVSLSASTIRDNSRFFTSIKEVPKQAITMGLSEIIDSDKIILIATGINKAKAVRDCVKGPIDESCPASILQKHNNVLLILDKDAASLL